MRKKALVGVLIGCCMTMAASHPARAQLTPLGPEVGLDPSADADFCPVLAAHADGTAAVGWTRLHGRGSAVLLRTVDADGSLGPLRTLDASSSSSQAEIEGVSALAAGYEAVWHKPTPPNHYPHFVQQLDASGGPAGTPAVLARHFVQMSPRPVGGIIAVWTSNKLLNVQRLGSNGAALGAPVRVRTTAFYPQVVHRASGEFVVVWRTAGSSHGDWVDGGYLAQRFSATGAATGKPFRVVPPPGGAVAFQSATAALGADGTLAVVSSVELAASIEDEQVTLRVYDAGGHLVGGPVPITTHADAAIAQTFPKAVAVDHTGRVLVVWSWEEDVEEPHARARLFARDGSPVGDFLDPVSEVSRGQSPSFFCAAAAWNGNEWLVAWSGWTSPIDDAEHSQIWLRRFGG